jgi:hypothetical protein
MVPFGKSVASVAVIDDMALFHCMTTLFGPHEPNNVTDIAMLLILS